VKVIFGKRETSMLTTHTKLSTMSIAKCSALHLTYYGARSRITHAIIPESTISRYRDLVTGKTLPATNQDCIKTSTAITTLAMPAKRRGNLARSEDGFTCDPENLAQFCAVAEPFDFDIKNLFFCPSSRFCWTHRCDIRLAACL
jgi:hypothetical protein